VASAKLLRPHRSSSMCNCQSLPFQSSCARTRAAWRNPSRERRKDRVGCRGCMTSHTKYFLCSWFPLELITTYHVDSLAVDPIEQIATQLLVGSWLCWLSDHLRIRTFPVLFLFLAAGSRVCVGRARST
jgi:hypothetical protein